MNEILKTGFADRLSTAADAKRAQLEKFRPKPTVTPEEFVDRQTRKAQELEAVREARAEAKEAARLAAVEAERLTQEAKKGQRKERKALTKAEQKAKRDARYAARQARK